MKEYVRKVTRVGKLSYSVVIPKDMIEELGWRERQKLVLKLRGKQVVVCDWKPKK